MKLFGEQKNKDGMLFIGNTSAQELVEKFGSPLYVYDESLLRKTAQTYVEQIKNPAFETKVLYASKAASFVGLIKLAHEEGLHLDVVSEGELYTAFKAGFPMEKVVFHGNNKLERELVMALDYGIGTVVVDNESEARRLSALAVSKNKSIDVLLRVNPCIDAHTHAYIQTATSDSKFGVLISQGRAEIVLRTMQQLEGLTLRGIHCHIGSQIFAADSFKKAALVMLDFMAYLKDSSDLHLDVLNLGGGFGVYYSQGDEPFDVGPFLHDLSNMIAREADKRKVALNELWIEPGRSMVNSSGITLYTVGDTKQLPEEVNYIFIDGGMGDNMRPSLYGATYECAIANKLNDDIETKWRIAGKYCESGDVIIKDASLPTPQPGDVLAVFGTGAYCFSMHSDYNRLLRPAVVFVNEEQARLVVRRETLDDLIGLDSLE